MKLAVFATLTVATMVLVIAVAASWLRYTYGPTSYERNRALYECREGPGGNAAVGECG